MDEERAARRRKRWMALAILGCGAILLLLLILAAYRTFALS